MARFKIVTPAGASFSVHGGGYAYEMEALEGLDAEITRGADRRDRLHRRRARRRRALRQGHPHHRADHRLPGELPRHRPRQRRRRLGRREGGDRARHPGDQRARHLHRGGGRPRHVPAPGRLPPPGRAGPHGARRPLARGPPGAPEDPAPDGPDARLHLLRPRRPRGRQARRALRPPHDRLRPLRGGNADLRPRRAARDPLRGAGPVGLRLHARPRAARGPPHAARAALPADEAERGLREHRPRPDGGRGRR